MAYGGEVSGPLSPTISSLGLRDVLNSFVGIDNVTVTGGNQVNFEVTFGGTQAATNMQQILGDVANVTNGTPVRTITTAYNAASEVVSVIDPASTKGYFVGVKLGIRDWHLKCYATSSTVAHHRWRSTLNRRRIYASNESITVIAAAWGRFSRGVKLGILDSALRETAWGHGKSRKGTQLNSKVERALR